MVYSEVATKATLFHSDRFAAPCICYRPCLYSKVEVSLKETNLSHSTSLLS